MKKKLKSPDNFAEDHGPRIPWRAAKYGPKFLMPNLHRPTRSDKTVYRIEWGGENWA